MSITRPGIAIVATPIGNLGDISQRAIDTLRDSDLILAEDTRVSKRLLQAIGADTPLQAFHAYNEGAKTDAILARIVREQLHVALISDAGTPLISDPGFPLIRQAGQHGIAVTVIPGPCAAIAALILSGLPADSFIFDGFLPPRSAVRRQRLSHYLEESRTVVLYEAPHRLRALLADARQELGDEREIVIARELTKMYETVYRGVLGDIEAQIAADPYAEKGELVIVLGPAPERHRDVRAVDDVLRKALQYLSTRDAVALTSDLTGMRRNDVYQRCLDLGGGNSHTDQR